MTALKTRTAKAPGAKAVNRWSQDQRRLVYCAVAILVLGGNAETLQGQALPETALDATSRPATTEPSAPDATASKVPFWADRVNDVRERLRSGRLVPVTTTVQNFLSIDEAREASKSASFNHPERLSRGSRLEASQTWFYSSDGTYDEPGPVHIQLLTEDAEATTGLLFELTEFGCERTDGETSYHLLVTKEKGQPGKEQVLVARIPPRYLSRGSQCGTILEAW